MNLSPFQVLSILSVLCKELPEIVRDKEITPNELVNLCISIFEKLSLPFNLSDMVYILSIFCNILKLKDTEEKADDNLILKHETFNYLCEVLNDPDTKLSYFG